MALHRTVARVLRIGTDLGVKNKARHFKTAAVLCRRTAPLGPMPNEDIDWNNLEALEKYCSYTRYLQIAEEASNKDVWWKTYRKHVEQKSDNDFKPVDIGLPHCRPSRLKEARERRKVMKENKKNPELERAARLRTFRIPLDEVKQEWEKTNGPYHIHRLAEHYGIYRDLFPMAYFVPRVMLRVAYGDDKDAMVHYGNHLSPSQASSAPHISFEAEENSLWTLLLTSPALLRDKLFQLNVPDSMCSWITDFLTDRRQFVRLGTHVSDLQHISTGSPQGCVLSPLLFSLYTNGCTSDHQSVKLLKFADDTTLIGLISDGDESAYRGTTITKELKWEQNIRSLTKKAQQRMYFLRQLKKFLLPVKMLVNFYTAIIESVLTSSITVWFAAATARDKAKLQRVIHSAEKVIGCSLPSLQELYFSRSRRAAKIAADPSHPGNELFRSLPSGKRLRSIRTRTSRHKNSFFPTAVSLLNNEHLQDGEQEYVHWLVGNIPGNAVISGEEISHYLAPFPAKGTGFHRYIFILFKQEAAVDFSSDIRPKPCYSLQQRSFKTLDFYRKHEDQITPAGLAFFQSQWDNSVTSTFHTLFNMREPVFEYDRPPVYHPPQKKYPHGQPLRYMDRYRGRKEHTHGIY
ncbi:hypothetical protein QTP86_033816 [Hemibagrus guttatus]|nr:hypothetical protein QTP86_033816 [Hemibagrus guttatus]